MVGRVEPFASVCMYRGVERMDFCADTITSKLSCALLDGLCMCTHAPAGVAQRLPKIDRAFVCHQLN
jgi:hypothetical protein